MPAKINYPVEKFDFTAPVILGFPNLFVARAFEGDKNKSFDVQALFPGGRSHPDFDRLNKLIATMVARDFPGRAANELAFCLHDGDKLADAAAATGKNRDYYRGYMVLKCRSSFAAPLCVHLNGKATDIPGGEDGEKQFGRHFYGGVEAYISVDLHSYPGNAIFKPGVAAWPTAVYSLSKGENITELNTMGGGSAVSRFQYVTGHHTDINPMAGLI